MPEAEQASWDCYNVTRIGDKGCLPLERTGHVTHVETALQIFRTGEVRPGLVREGDSRLDAVRVEVLFTTPHDFSIPHGCMFGTVCFEFDWQRLVEGKNYYWIGAKQFSPYRPRILITDEFRPEYMPYDPATKGPWWRRKKTGLHYWNGHYPPEFLFEATIPVSEIKQLRFVAGHERCRSKPCPDKNHERGAAAARLLAGVCHRDLFSMTRRLWVWGPKEPRKALLFAWKELRNRMGAGLQTRRAGMKWSDKKASAHAWASMGAVLEQQRGFLKDLLGGFVGPKNAVRACATLIEDKLELKKGMLPRELSGVK